MGRGDLNPQPSESESAAPPIVLLPSMSMGYCQKGIPHHISPGVFPHRIIVGGYSKELVEYPHKNQDVSELIGTNSVGVHDPKNLPTSVEGVSVGLLLLGDKLCDLLCDFFVGCHVYIVPFVPFVVGMAGFGPATFRPQTECSNQTELHPEMVAGTGIEPAWSRL